jgi:polysaccharide export outer membrane protein
MSVSSSFVEAAGSLPARIAAVPRATRFALVLLLVTAMVLLGGCANKRGGSIPYEPTGFVAPDAPSLTALDPDYRISPLDTLKVTVFQVPDLSGEFEVDLTGHIAMPLVGNVRAVDLTPEQLDTQLTRVLGEKYLQNPDVGVSITKSSSRNVTVTGSVRQAGMFPINGPMTLMQVVALARGTDENANPRRVAVFRKIQGQSMAAAFDLTDIGRGKAEDPRIYSGDIVVVDGSSVKAAQREILQSLPIFSLFRPF